jgi:DNA-binding CsgD family transcriptional regulator
MARLVVSCLALMRVNSNALLARKMIVTRRFGAEAWNQIFRRLARLHPCLRAPLTASSQVPVAEFLAFNEELADRLYGGDASSTYFDLGEQSAAWAFVDGPCKSFIEQREIGQLAESFALIWRAYYTETASSCQGKVTRDGVEFSVAGLPHWHPYFEYLFTGFMKGAMELVCANPVEATRLRGDSEGFTYLLHTGLGDADGEILQPSSSARRGKDRMARSGLSPREIEVLRLMAHGKTNKEIGCLLGISDRTVQNHVTHIYDKIGAYSRAGATAWLAEHRGRLD